MFSLIPKERVFFDLFEKAAANAVLCTKELVEFFDRFDNLTDRASRIKDLEHRGDELTHDTIERLNKTFVTPLDREDIHELICRIDDILDRIDTAVDRVCLFKIKEPMEDARKMARCIAAGAVLIQEMIGNLRHMKHADEVRHKVMEVHRLENEADRIERHALASLFENQPDPINVIKWKNIIEVLESAMDRCERRRQHHRRDRSEECMSPGSCGRSSAWRWCSTTSTASTTPPTRSPPWCRRGC